VFCLFLIGIVTFISGNLAQVNAATSSTVLPIAKGGTGANSASGARTNLNAQETLVSGTNIKTAFGNSLLGSGNISNISYNKVSGLALGETAAAYSGYDGAPTFAGITCTFKTGICSWVTCAYCDVMLEYVLGESPSSIKTFNFTNSTDKPVETSQKILGAGWYLGWATGTITNNTGIYEVSLYKRPGSGSLYLATRVG
jgi:hypothetical protein